MRRLIIVGRHGNTFEASQKVVMVGAKQDLPLTEFGRQQARLVGEGLKSYASVVESVRAAPLARTLEYAQILCGSAGVAPQVVIDQRLTELDYGAWGGLSDAEIVALCGAALPLEDWRERSLRPQRFPFEPSAEAVECEVRALLEELAQVRVGVSVVITSNGRLREIGRLIGQQHSLQSWKVGTGKLCVLEYAHSSWSIVAWDIAPDRLAGVLGSPDALT
jgi:broad specificity phosphatase PhoE